MKRANTAAMHLDQLIDLKHLAPRFYQPMPQPLSLMPPSGTPLAAQQTDAAVLPLGKSKAAARYPPFMIRLKPLHTQVTAMLLDNRRDTSVL